MASAEVTDADLSPMLNCDEELLHTPNFEPYKLLLFQKLALFVLGGREGTPWNQSTGAIFI